MLRYALFAVVALVIAAPSQGHAQEDGGEGEYMEQYDGGNGSDASDGTQSGEAENGQKRSWRERFQRAQGAVIHNKGAQDTAKALKDKYGTLSEEQATALRERAGLLKDHQGEWEGWKAAHPDIVAKLQGTEEERRKQWEEWRADHRYDADKLETSQEALRQKWEDWKATRASKDPYARDQATEHFKFTNRDEAIEGMKKYKDWSKVNPEAAQTLKEKAAEWKAAHSR